MPPLLGVIVGMRSEARAIAGRLPPGSLIEIGAADPTRTKQAVHRLLARGATHLLSLGLAGALRPGLDPGDLVAANRVISSVGGATATDAGWLARLELPARAVTAGILGSDRALASAAEKASCYAETGAVAVDMESHILAAMVADRPLLVLRAIVDPADRTLPPAALLPLRADGTPDLRRMTAELARHPRQIGPLIRLAIDARAALATLRGVAGLIGGSLLP